MLSWSEDSEAVLCGVEVSAVSYLPLTACWAARSASPDAVLSNMPPSEMFIDEFIDGVDMAWAPALSSNRSSPFVR